MAKAATRSAPEGRFAGGLLCALPLVLALVYFPGLELPFSVAKASALYLITAALLRTTAAKWQPRPKPVLLLLGCFVGLVLVSCGVSRLRYMTVPGMAWYLVGPLLFVAARSAIRNRANLFLRYSAVSGVAVAVIGLAQLALGQDFLFPVFGSAPQPMVGRLHLFSTLGNPDFLAAYCAITAPALLAFRWSRSSAPLLAFALAAIVTTVWLSGSRAGALALIVGAVVAAAFLLQSAKLRIGLAALIVVLAGFAILSARNPRTVQDAFTGRTVVWRATLSDSSRFGFGSGPGTFTYLYPIRVGRFVAPPERADLRRYAGNESHGLNDYVEMWSELGLAALLVFFAGVAYWLCFAVRMVRSKERTGKQEIVCSLAIISALLADALFDFPLHRAETWGLFWLLLAIPFSFVPVHTAASKTSIKIARWSIAVVLAIALGLQGARMAIASYCTQQGIRNEARHLPATAAEWYVHAISWNPTEQTARFNYPRTLDALQFYGVAYAESIEMLRWVNEPECWILSSRIAQDMGAPEIAAKQVETAAAMFPYSEAVEAERRRIRALPEAR